MGAALVWHAVELACPGAIPPAVGTALDQHTVGASIVRHVVVAKGVGATGKVEGVGAVNGLIVVVIAAMALNNLDPQEELPGKLSGGETG